MILINKLNTIAVFLNARYFSGQNSQLKYSLQRRGLDSVPFEIDEKHGYLILQRPVDREIKDKYQFNITVSIDLTETFKNSKYLLYVLLK